MDKTTLTNLSGAPVRFRIDLAPGEEPLRYDVAPGDTCEVPTGYVASGLIARIAPGLSAEAPPPKPKPKPAEAKEDEPKPKPKRRRRKADE